MPGWRSSPRASGSGRSARRAHSAPADRGAARGARTAREAAHRRARAPPAARADPARAAQAHRPVGGDPDRRPALAARRDPHGGRAAAAEGRPSSTSREGGRSDRRRRLADRPARRRPRGPRPGADGRRLPDPAGAHRCRALTARVLEELRLAHEGRAIFLSVRADGWAELDPDRFAQALTNLVSNALAHGEADGAIDVAIEGEGRWLRLSVHNRGEPIPKDLLPRLFDPFRSGSASPGGERPPGSPPRPRALHRPRDRPGPRRPGRGELGARSGHDLHAPLPPARGGASLR